jgi:hypothetical protein
MKKLTVLFVFICMLLLSGGQHLIAGTSQACNPISQSVGKKYNTKFTNHDSNNSLIEEADFGGDEEHLGGDIDDGITNKLFTGNYSDFNNWYLAISCQLLSNQSHKNFKIFAPFCGRSNPIYITQQVLRL